MISLTFHTGLHLDVFSPEELKKAYRRYRETFEQIERFTSKVREDLDDLREAIRITRIGLCAGDWERIGVIQKRLNEDIEGLRQAQEDYPKRRKTYMDLHRSLSASQDHSHEGKAHEDS